MIERGASQLVRRLAIAAAVVTGATTVGLSELGQAARVRTAYGPTIEIAGRGFGHGRGMGQWGAYGYAVERGWTATAMLDRYYGGTVPSQVAPGATVSVRLQELDNRDTIVVQEQGRLLTSAAPGRQFQALLVRETPERNFALYTGTDCTGGPGGWQPLTADGLPPVPGAAPLTVPGTAPVSFSVAAYDLMSTEPTAHLAVCEPDNQRRYYRGGIQSWIDSTGVQRTVNVVEVEQYLRGNVPREMPASWGDAGGGRGIEALAIQAVAARSYAMSQRRYSYAMTCDSMSCQVYRGMAEAPAVGGTPRRLEDARTDRAILATSGQVRLVNGAVGSLEYSSSTGGWTAGGTFPVVEDQGDAVAANPQKSWTAKVSTTTITDRYPQLGGLDLIEVTRRNGAGEWGGRVQQVRLTGPLGSVTVSGWDFSKVLNLKSDWFNIVTQPLAAAPPPTPAPVAPVVTPPTSSATQLPVRPVAASVASANRFFAVDLAGTVVGGNGAATFGGGLGGKPAVAIASVNDAGYWIAAADGTIAAFGVPSFGSAPSTSSPVVALVARPQADGLWVVRANGTVVTLGAAPKVGQITRKLRRPITAAATTPSGGGLFLLAADGSIFTFGDAKFSGSTRSAKLPLAAVSITVRPTGGYLVAHANGSVRGFGGAVVFGERGRAGVAVSDIVATPSGNGYRVVWSDGAIDPYGDA